MVLENSAKKKINPLWVGKFEQVVKDLLAKNNLYNSDTAISITTKDDKFEVKTQLTYSQDKRDIGSDAHVLAQHKDAKKNVEKAVSAAVKSLGAHKVTVTVGYQGKTEYDNAKNFEYGSCQVNILIDAPKFALFKSLKEIAKELKAEGYGTQTYKDELEVEYQSDALGKWEYKCWEMNLTQYQDANNKLHQELAKKLKEKFPQYIVRPDEGFNESGYAIAFIKMP